MPKTEAFFFVLVIGAVSITSWAADPKDTCKAVYQTNIKDGCDLKLYLHASSLESCSNQTILSKNKCLNRGCCWHNTTVSSAPKCFAKPKKCYIDLRREKCNALRGTSFQGIYTGYSANGSYCHVSTISISDDQDRELLGYHHNDGFEINLTSKPAVCRRYWKYNATALGKNKCMVKVENKTGHLTGTLQFNKSCIHYNQQRDTFYSFPLDNNTKCMCRVEAWVQYINEDVKVSKNVLKYIRNLENRSSCTQVLGNMIRSSWRNRVVPVNREEVDVVVEAFSNLTKPEDVRDFTYLDAEVLLHSARKISDYSFYEGLARSSATDIVSKTTTAMNNLIWRFSHIPESNGSNIQSEGVAELRAAVSPESSAQDSTATRNNENQSRVKFDIFQTLETVTETIARHIQTNNQKDFHLRANETYVDLRISVANAHNATKMLNRNQSENTISNSQEQAVITKLPAGTLDPSGDNVAVMSVFYNFPVSKDDAVLRASDYLSVNLWKFHQGNASHVSVPVDFTLKWTNTTRNRSALSCQFLTSNLTTDENETFSDFGCKVSKWNDKEVTCTCNHTTHFAVLLKFTGDSVSAKHNKIMRVMSLVLGGLSIACLAVTVLVFVACRESLIKDRMLIHFHLVLALLGGYIALLLSALFTSPDEEVGVTCIGSAIASHFFFLAVFFWSLVEGFYLFYKIVLVFERKWVEGLPTYAPVLGWVCPAVLVSVAFILSRTSMEATPSSGYTDSYVNPHTCFLNERSGMIWFFMGPVVAIILLNLLILSKVMLVIYQATSSSSRLASADKSVRITESLRRSSRGALILMPILSLPWIVGFLYNFYTADSDIGVVVGTAGAYIQVFLAGTQGILVFLFYCVYNADVKNAYQLSARRRKSVSSLQTTNTQRKRSRIPLLFSSAESQESTLRSNSNARASQRSHSQSVCSRYQTRRSTSASVHPGLVSNSVPAYGRSTSNESGKPQQFELS